MAESGSSRNCFELFVSWIKAEIATAYHRGGRRIIAASLSLAGRVRFNFATVARTRGVDAVIESPLRIIHHGLHVIFAKAGKNLTANISPPITVGVF